MTRINHPAEPVVASSNVAMDHSTIITGTITESAITIIHPAGDSVSKLLVSAGSEDYDKNLFVHPVNFEDASAKLRTRKLLWISGPPRAGKTWLAAHLVETVLPAAAVYKLRNWQDLVRMAKAKEVRKAAIILANADYLAREFEEVEAEADVPETDEPEDEVSEPVGEIVEVELAAIVTSVTSAPLEASDAAEEGEEIEAEGEIHAEAMPPAENEVADDLEEAVEGRADGVAVCLQQILERDNTVILTSSEEVFAQVRPDFEIFPSQDPEAFVVCLKASSYGMGERLKLLWSSINQACEHKAISNEASGWAKAAYKQLEVSDLTTNESPLFKDWLPGEIYDFVCSILLWATEPEAVKNAFNLPLYDRARALVREIGLSDKCFLLTLALSPEANGVANKGTYGITNRMKEITSALKKDYELTQQPIDAYNRKAAPYVLEFQFVNRHVAEVVAEEMARLYPDIFDALIPLFKRWSVPENLNRVEETAPIRTAIARLAGKVGRYNLEYVQGLLEYWASQQSSRIGQSAGVALRVASHGSNQSGQTVRNLIREWAKASESPTGAYFRRSAADAIWQVATFEPQEEKCRWALELLKRLVKDRNPYVRESAARAMVKLARAYSLTWVEFLLVELADTQEMSSQAREKVCFDLARQLVEASLNREEVAALIEARFAVGQPALLRTAVCYLLLIGNRTEREWLLLHRILREQPRNFVSAINLMLGRTLQWKHWKPFWSRILDELAKDTEPLANQQAALALYRLREKAAGLGMARIEKYVKGALVRWETKPDAPLEIPVLIYNFLRCAAGNRLTFLKEHLDPLALNESREQRVQAALRLHLLRTGLLWTNRLNNRAQRTLNKLLESWLVSGNETACDTAIFYWLMAPNYGEDVKCKLLAQILVYFHPRSENAMKEAVRALPLAQLSNSLRLLASKKQALIRKQVAAAASQLTNESAQVLDDLILSFLETDELGEYANSKACVTVIFYWILSNWRSEESRYQAITQMLNSFPREFRRAMREGAEVLSAEDLLPVITQLAGNPSDFVRQNAASALDEVARAEPWKARELLTVWTVSTNTNLRETGLYCCFIGQSFMVEDRQAHLIECLRTDPLFFLSILQQAWNDLIHATQARLAVAALGQTEKSRVLLIEKLMDVYQEAPELVDSLLDRFRVSELSNIREIHAEFCRRQFRIKNEKSL